MAKVVVIGALPKSLINFRGEFLKALIAKGCSVTAMADDDDNMEVSTWLENHGIQYIPFPIKRNGLNPLQDVKTFFTLTKVFTAIRPDILLAYTIKPVIWGGLAASIIIPKSRFYALITGLGFAFKEGNLFRSILKKLVKYLYRLSLSNACGVIFQNPDNLNNFICEKIIPRENGYLVNGSGVNLKHFNQSSLPQGDPVFLFVGRLIVEKGIREFIRAAQLVKDIHPNAIFRVLGPPDPSPDGISSDEINSWHVNGIIQYLGKTNDVRPYIYDSHIFVLPTFYLEGIPRTILEAMAIGRPILTTDMPGCRETIIPGENGFLVPPKDAHALADKMIWFIENRNAWEQMGKRSRQLAEERFDVHSVNRELLRIMGI